MKQDSSLTNKWGMCRGWGDKEGLGTHLFTIGKVYSEEEIEALGIRAWIQWHSQPLINLLFSLQGYCALFKFGSSFVFMIYDPAPLSPTSEVFYVEPRVLGANHIMTSWGTPRGMFIYSTIDRSARIQSLNFELW